METAHVHFGGNSSKAVEDWSLVEQITGKSFWDLSGCSAFIAELERCCNDPLRRKPTQLRFDTQFEEVNSGSIQVQVVLGYMEGEMLRELAVDCGRDYLGSDKSQAETATGLADAVYERFSMVSKTLGLDFAGGQYMVS